MNYAIDFAWEEGRRGFWTQRKKSTTGLLTVLALISGLAVAYKLFDSSVPNNVVRDAATFDYQVWKMDSELGETTFVDTADGRAIFEAGVENFPGDTRTVDVKIANVHEQPQRDASFFVYVDQPSITATGCHDSSGNATPVEEDASGNESCSAGSTTASPTTISPTGSTQQAWTRFVNAWTIDIDKQLVLQAAGSEVNEDDHTGQNLLQPNGNPDDSGRRRYDEACGGNNLQSLRPNNPCSLGIVRAKDSRDALGEATDQRYYLFNLTETDEMLDQSAYKGWTVTFSFVFQARVPALPEPGLER